MKLHYSVPASVYYEYNFFKALEFLNGVTQFSRFSIQIYLISEAQVSFAGFLAFFFLVFLFLTVSQVHGFVCTYKNDCELPACQLMKHSYHRQCKNADAVGQLIYSSSFHCCVTFLTVKLVARKFTRISSWYGSEQTRGH